MSIYIFSFIYVWFLVRGFFFQIHCIFAEMFLFLKKNSWKPNHLCARSLYFEKCCDFEQVKKLFLACMCSWKLMWNKKCISESMRYIQTIWYIRNTPPPPLPTPLNIHACTNWIIEDVDIRWKLKFMVGLNGIKSNMRIKLKNRLKSSKHKIIKSSNQSFNN